jgi:hypothetical protein
MKPQSNSNRQPSPQPQNNPQSPQPGLQSLVQKIESSPQQKAAIAAALKAMKSDSA